MTELPPAVLQNAVDIVDGAGRVVCALGICAVDGKYELRAATNDAETTTKLLDSVKRPAAQLDTEEEALAALKDVVGQLQSAGFTSRPPEGSTVHTRMIFGAHQEESLSVVQSGPGGPAVASLARDMADRIRARFAQNVDEAARSIEQAASGADHASAVAALRDAQQSGVFLFKPTDALFRALHKVDVSVLQREDAAEVLIARIHVANELKQRTEQLADIERYTALMGDEIDPPLRAEFVRMRGLAAMQANQREVAYALFQQALADAGATASMRGSCHASLARLQEDDSLKASHLERAADAYLEAGQRQFAASCYVELSKLLYATDPKRGLDLLARATEWFPPDDLLDRNRRAALLHTKALLLMRLSRWHDAYSTARDAIALRKDLMGAEEQYLSTLHAAKEAAEHAAVAEAEQDEIADEIARVDATTNDPETRLRHRAAALVAGNSDEAPEALLVDVKASGNPEFLFLWHVGRAIDRKHPLSFPEQLRHLDEAHSILDANRGLRNDRELQEILFHAFAQAYHRQGDYVRAADWYRRLLALDPFHPPARQNYLNILFSQKQWTEASGFLENQIRLHGELPGLGSAFGRVLLELGDANRALAFLLRAERQAPSQEFRDKLKPYIDRATAVATNVDGRPIPRDKPGPIIGTRELDDCFSRFAAFIQSSKRKGFWKADKERARDWIPKPETRAQDLFHTFVKAELGDGVEILEDVDAGAGRIDVYLRLSDGTRAVVELKMCGGRYPKSYARGGIEQLAHYMENKGTGLGYLLVFDGRMRDFKVALPAVETEGAHTVFIRVVDVRPFVKQRHDDDATSPPTPQQRRRRRPAPGGKQ
jgi:tetratricopeptide (TPR) repeat protein